VPHDPPRVIACGDSGGDVRQWQVLLACAEPGLDVDGRFGPATYRAVQAFQRERGLTADGVIGPATQAALLTLADGCPLD
jgi:peptidoglycan hydrolase-like protein with peptidoglycan-binding domain